MIARLLRRRPSPALVISGIALIFAMAGTSIAAVNALPRNSVGPLQLKTNAVTSIKVKDHSLLRKDFATNQVPAGPAGPAGPPGAGSSNWVITDATGAIVKSAGIIAVSHSGTGIYDVTFSKDVSGCGFLATGGSNASTSGIFGRIANYSRTATATVIRFTTSIGSVPTDSGFSAAAIC